MFTLLQSIVGDLESLEGDWFLHPVTARSWRIWMEVEVTGEMRISFSNCLPVATVPFIPSIVQRYYIHQHQVERVRVQA